MAQVRALVRKLVLRAANEEGTSIPRFTKRAVFQKLGLLVGGKGF
jgi:hypothetical protein